MIGLLAGASTVLSSLGGAGLATPAAPMTPDTSTATAGGTFTTGTMGGGKSDTSMLLIVGLVVAAAFVLGGRR
jgi:hypothetical protein